MRATRLLRVIGVTASTSVFQAESAGASPAWRTNFQLPSWCHQSALDVVNVAEPVRIRPREPLSFVHKAKSRAVGLQNRVTQCEPGMHVHFSKRIRGSQQTRLVWSQEALGAAPRYPIISSFMLHPLLPPCSSTAEHPPLKRSVPVQLRPGLPISSWKPNWTSAPGRS